MTPSLDALVRQRTDSRRSKVDFVSIAVDPTREGILQMNASQSQYLCSACDTLSGSHATPANEQASAFK